MTASVAGSRRPCLGDVCGSALGHDAAVQGVSPLSAGLVEYPSYVSDFVGLRCAFLVGFRCGAGSEGEYFSFVAM